MKQLLTFVLIVLTAAGCQINVMQPQDDGIAVVPDMNARVARKLNIGGQDGKTVYSEERYEYNAQKLLTKVSYLYRGASGQLEVISYDEPTYNEQQQLQQVTTYQLRQGKPYATSVKRYEYPASNKIVERQFGINNNGQPAQEYNRSETLMDGDRKAQVNTYYHDGKTFVKGFSRVFRYESGRLVAEESLNQNGVVASIFRYLYKGRSATVGEFMANRAESISEQKFEYDSRGRLIRSEVTQMNPLLCVAFVQGSATVYEYVD